MDTSKRSVRGFLAAILLAASLLAAPAASAAQAIQGTYQGYVGLVCVTVVVGEPLPGYVIEQRGAAIEALFEGAGADLGVYEAELAAALPVAYEATICNLGGAERTDGASLYAVVSSVRVSTDYVLTAPEDEYSLVVLHPDPESGMYDWNTKDVLTARVDDVVRDGEGAAAGLILEISTQQDDGGYKYAYYYLGKIG